MLISTNQARYQHTGIKFSRYFHFLYPDVYSAKQICKNEKLQILTFYVSGQFRSIYAFPVTSIKILFPSTTFYTETTLSS